MAGNSLKVALKKIECLSLLSGCKFWQRIFFFGNSNLKLWAKCQSDNWLWKWWFALTLQMLAAYTCTAAGVTSQHKRIDCFWSTKVNLSRCQCFSSSHQQLEARAEQKDQKKTCYVTPGTELLSATAAVQRVERQQRIQHSWMDYHTIYQWCQLSD